MDDWSSVEEFDVNDDLTEILTSSPVEAVHSHKTRSFTWDDIGSCLFNNTIFLWLRFQYIRFVLISK